MNWANGIGSREVFVVSPMSAASAISAAGSGSEFEEDILRRLKSAFNVES